MKKYIYRLFAIAVGLLLVIPVSASAINYGGIGGSPANPNPNNPRSQSIFIYQLEPGQSASDAVKVINNTNQPQTVTLDAVDSELATGGNFTCKQAAEPKTGVGNWIQLQTTSVTLTPNSSQSVPFTITVPTGGDVGVGEHDGCITIQAASQTATSDSSSSGVLLSFRSAIRVAVTIPGKIIKRLEIQDVKVTAGPNSKYVVSPVVKNSGNVSLDTTVLIKLRSLLGTAAVSKSEGSSPVLPNTTASWDYTVSRPFWGGFYRAQVIATYDSNTANGLGTKTNTQPVSVVKSSSLFFIAPSVLGSLIELAVLLLIIGGLYWGLQRRQNRRLIQKDWKAFTVGESDTLQSLAQKYGTTWRRIAKVNKLKPPYDLKKGQKLKLPHKKR